MQEQEAGGTLAWRRREIFPNIHETAHNAKASNVANFKLGALLEAARFKEPMSTSFTIPALRIDTEKVYALFVEMRF